MRVALDTNVLVYAAGVNGEERKAAAAAAVESLEADEVFVPVQVLGELMSVLARKGRWDGDRARREVERWIARTMPIETTLPILRAAMSLAAAHRLSTWDSIVLAAAAQAGCRELLSEDMQHGFAWRGVTVRNPFRSSASI